jgi:hypothetical protein
MLTPSLDETGCIILWKCHENRKFTSNSLTLVFYSPNPRGFQFNLEWSWQFQKVVLPVLARLGVSKSLKIQAL